MLQVLVDADNVARSRLAPVLELLANVPDARITASGRPSALSRLSWPEHARLLPSTGWQRADLALAEAYRPNDDPLLLVSGDGDFGLLATRHPGAVLVVSGAASGRLRDGTTVVDPGHRGRRADQGVAEPPGNRASARCGVAAARVVLEQQSTDVEQYAGRPDDH